MYVICPCSIVVTYNATFALRFKRKHLKIDLPIYILEKRVVPALGKCKYLGIIVREAHCESGLNTAYTVHGCIRKCIPTKKRKEHAIESWNDKVKHCRGTARFEFMF